MLAGQTALTGTKELCSRDLQLLWNLRIHTRAAFKHLEIVELRGAPYPRSGPFLRMAQKIFIHNGGDFFPLFQGRPRGCWEAHGARVRGVMMVETARPITL